MQPRENAQNNNTRQYTKSTKCTWKQKKL